MVVDHETTEYVNMVVYHATPKGESLDEIAKATKDDPILAQVIKRIQTNSWTKNLKPFHQLRHNLSLHEEILLKDHTIVIPSSTRNDILQLAHKQHLGIVKTKSLLREKVWWPGISTDIEKFIS
uniref:Integrase zinc-binding domain-containing protein n=1 Tax=Clytia hemisphaerica TaxID=252671 RepID=A0A7M5V7J8_9CNID